MSNFLYTFTGTLQIEADDEESASKHFWDMVRNLGCRDIVVTNTIADDEESDAIAFTFVYKRHTVAITRDSSHTGYDVAYYVYIDGMEPAWHGEGDPGPAAVARAKAFIDEHLEGGRLVVIPRRSCSGRLAVGS